MLAVGGREVALSGDEASKTLGASRSNVAPLSLQLMRRSAPRATTDAPPIVSTPPSSRPTLEITNRPDEAIVFEPGFSPSFLIRTDLALGMDVRSVLCNWIRQAPLAPALCRSTLTGETFISSMYVKYLAAMLSSNGVIVMSLPAPWF